MSVAVRLALWCNVLALLACYAWWCRYRVWLLRQDLFAIRDSLWDAMRARGMLDDSEHRRFRDGINDMIRFAPDLTLFTVWRILVTGVAPATERSAPVIPDVEAARQATFHRLARYLLFESLAGVGLVAVAVVFRLSRLTRDWMVRKLQSIFDSPSMRDFARAASGRQTAPGI